MYSEKKTGGGPDTGVAVASPLRTLVPPEWIATTAKEYAVSFVRPVTVTELVEALLLLSEVVTPVPLR
tara:strand:- start:804 stop:1007 length:204 start_codon:yes stop_codon:yes gene_type:complete